MGFSICWTLPFGLTIGRTILLDGVYSFVSLLMTFIAQRVSRLVQTPYSQKFHFGFAHFEPMLNVMRILIILSIAAFAATSALDALLKGKENQQALEPHASSRGVF